MKRCISFLTFAGTLLGATSVLAAPAATGTAKVSPTAAPASGSAGSTAKPWIKRHRPRPRQFEIGAYLGVVAPDQDLNLRDPSQPALSYDRVAADLGFRIGYYPLRHFGFEGEVGIMPTQTETNSRANLYTARAHGILQLGLWRVTPFVLLGGGVLGVTSGDNVQGNDTDAALHVGGGVKIAINRRWLVRLDVRDILSPKNNEDILPANSVEALVGISVRLGPRKRKVDLPPLPPDADADGIIDDKDQCPEEAGPAPTGCPVKDTDGDGVDDVCDACPEEAGKKPDGCPVRDADGDGFDDDADKCPQEAGVAPDGCPIRDTDGDGIDDPQDKCVDKPETANGFEDDDGCPDELPKEVKQFTGVIEGIYFATGRATIRPTSRPLLDKAADVLAQYPDLRMEISGHTDDRGGLERNMKLSQDRADAVKSYLVGKGVAADRITTRGAGPNEPVAENTSKAGRGKNRRIEFRLVQSQPKEGAP